MSVSVVESTKTQQALMFDAFARLVTAGPETAAAERLFWAEVSMSINIDRTFAYSEYTYFIATNIQ